jgi:mannosyl-oligosaccharide alpha-1,2-mannosidase
LLLGSRVHQYETLYKNAIEAIKQHLLFKPMIPTENDILLSGTARIWRPGSIDLDPKMSHLTCFAGGMFALGAKTFNHASDLEVARKLVDGCIWAYKALPTGIMPETFHVVPCPGSEQGHCKWNEEVWARDMIARNSNDEQHGDKDLPWKERIDRKAERLRLPKGISAIANRQYLLRPEAIESIFVLYRTTGNERLRDEAWAMFEAITDQTRTEIAFSSIDDVTKPNSRKLDRMESYWTAETLKYFFLLFSTPDVISLDRYVFNTEGHPFVIGYNSH